MFAIFRRNEFRTLVLAAGATLALAVPSYATHVDISGTHSESEIKSKCQAAGGQFSPSNGPDDGYGCYNMKDGATVGVVGCNSQGHCVGWVPGRLAPESALGVPTGTLSVDPDMSSLTSGDNSGGHTAGSSHGPLGVGGIRAGNAGLSSKP